MLMTSFLLHNNIWNEILQDIKRHDQGIYRCRVDFRTAQTQSFRFNLSVISEYRKWWYILHIHLHTHIYYQSLNLSICLFVRLLLCCFSTSGAAHHTGPLGSSAEWDTIGS